MRTRLDQLAKASSMNVGKVNFNTQLRTGHAHPLIPAGTANRRFGGTGG